MRQVGSSCGEAFLGVTTEESVRPPKTLNSGGLASGGCVGPRSAGCASARADTTHEINKTQIDRCLAKGSCMGRCTLWVLARVPENGSSLRCASSLTRHGKAGDLPDTVTRRAAAHDLVNCGASFEPFQAHRTGAELSKACWLACRDEVRSFRIM